MINLLKMFISGSIANNTIPDEVIKSVDVSMDKNYVILVGDAKGVDKNIQDLLKINNYSNVNIYHIGNKPRNLADKNWKQFKVIIDDSNPKLFKDGKFTRSAQMIKDKRMVSEADFGLVIWQDVSTNRFGNVQVSKGSLNNIYNLLKMGKPVGLYFVPKPDEGIIKLTDLTYFENEVISNMVNVKTKQYYYEMKSEYEKVETQKKHDKKSQGEQLKFF